MKKGLFLAIFSVFCLFLAGEARAWQRPMRCFPQVNPVGNQLNWIDGRGGLHPGHLDSANGFWTPPGCDRRFAYAQWMDMPRYSPGYNSPGHYPRYDRRYDRRHDRRGDNIGAAIAAGAAGGATVFVLEKVFEALVSNQTAVVPSSQPVYTPPQPVYTPPPPPVYTTPTTDRRCSSFRVTGDNQEATWAVERALRSRGYGVSASTSCEVAVRYEEVGDPQSRIFLRVTDAGGSVRHASGAQFFKSGDTLARADAIIIAARTAVGNL